MKTSPRFLEERRNPPRIGSLRGIRFHAWPFVVALRRERPDCWCWGGLQGRHGCYSGVHRSYPVHATSIGSIILHFRLSRAARTSVWSLEQSNAFPVSGYPTLPSEALRIPCPFLRRIPGQDPGQGRSSCFASHSSHRFAKWLPSALPRSRFSPLSRSRRSPRRSRRLSRRRSELLPYC